MIELTNKSKYAASSLSLDVTAKKWIVIGKHQGADRPFRINGIRVSFDPDKNLSQVPKYMTITGNWARKDGYKWGTREQYFHGIEFETLPKLIQTHIYDNVLQLASKLSADLNSQVMALSNAKGFIDTALMTNSEGKAVEDDVEGALPFLPSLRLHLPSPWENMDVSAWSVARKELK